jgi:hypothetical protein
MAKLAGHIKITGTKGNLTFYEMDGKYYVRMKSSLTGKQFRTKKCFAGSRQSAARFAKGNQIASITYRNLPKRMRIYDLFCVLKSAAIGLLKDGMTEAEKNTKEITENRVIHILSFCRVSHATDEALNCRHLSLS